MHVCPSVYQCTRLWELTANTTTWSERLRFSSTITFLIPIYPSLFSESHLPFFALEKKKKKKKKEVKTENKKICKNKKEKN